MFYFHIHDVHLCKCTILKKKNYKNLSLFHAESDAEAVWITELYEGILGRKLSRQEIGKFRAKLFFFFSPIPIQIANCSAIKMQRNIFSFSLCIKNSSALHCLSFQSKHLGQCYREALQLEKRKNALSAKKTPCSGLSMVTCTCRMEAWPSTSSPALSHYCFQSHHVFVFSQAGHTHFAFDWCQTEHLQLLLEKQASIKTFTSQPVHKDSYFSFEFLGCWAQPN